MKKNQLYVLTLLFAIISLGLNSCSKEKSFSSGGTGGTGGTGGGGGTGGSSTYFMKFKLDGVQKEFKANTFAIFTSMDMAGTMIYTSSFQATLSSSSTTNLMGININDITPIVVNKDYSDGIVGSTIQGALLYFDATGEQYSTLLMSTDVNLKIRITELTSTIVAGTFSGKMQAMTGTTVLNVTEGSFRIKR